jgi:hypothetical protein
MPQDEVKIVAWPSQPAKLELCVEVCRPICAQSEYTIGIEIFSRPVAQITVRGLTRLFNCDEQATHTAAATNK